MESATVSMIDEHTKILAAVSWKSEEEQPEFGDPNYIAFVQVMTYRREVARKYLYEENEENKKHIKLILEDCNDKIRQILGL